MLLRGLFMPPEGSAESLYPLLMKTLATPVFLVEIYLCMGRERQ